RLLLYAALSLAFDPLNPLSPFLTHLTGMLSQGLGLASKFQRILLGFFCASSGLTSPLHTYLNRTLVAGATHSVGDALVSSNRRRLGKSLSQVLRLLPRPHPSIPHPVMPIRTPTRTVGVRVR